MRLFVSLVVALLSWLSLSARSVRSEPILHQRLMDVVDIASDMSLLTILEEGENPFDFDYLHDFKSGADRAILGIKNGYCFVGFRGTVFLNLLDVTQNFLPGKRKICPSGTSQDCCEARTGYVVGYDNDYRMELENAIRGCVAECANPDKCLVLTGHSQGGSIAQVAAVALKEFNPLVMTLGNEPALFQGCQHLYAEQWIRFGNTRTDSFMGLVYDIVPFNFPFRNIDGPTYNYGYTYVMSDDTTGVASLGLNSQVQLGPDDILSIFMTHNLENVNENQRYTAYRPRIKKLIGKDHYPVRSSGYNRGFLCTKDIECASNVCPRGFFSRQCF